VKTKHLETLIVFFALIAAFTSSPRLAYGQTPPAIDEQQLPAPTDPAAKTIAQTASKDGIPLTTLSDLSGSVSVEGVLLPYKVAKRTFGKEVAEKYAVVSLIISNRDQKQGLILHSIFLDYSRWLFSGIFAGMTDSAKISTETWQQQSNPSQVASAEVRTVRTDFQDAQLWSTRSWVIHIATAIGTTAATLSYATGNDLFAPSVAAFNGAVVPALSLIWPDNSQTQLNLMNDIGFRTNRVIPSKSSDVVIAFFPLERFLTPTLQSIYKTAPAAFFNPSELIFDKSGRSGVGKLLREIEQTGLIAPTDCPGGSVKGAEKKSVQCTLVRSVLNYEQAYEQAKLSVAPGQRANPCAKPKDFGLDSGDCTNVDLLNRMSLNTIRLVVGGVMTVDASSVPATISSVKVANETLSATWKSGQKLSGILTGSILSGGTISITGTNPAGKVLDSALANLLADQTTASDTNLPFTATVGSSDIAPGSKLSFVVTKTAKDKSTTASSPFLYIVSSDPSVSVDASSTWTAGGKVSGSIVGVGLTGVTILSLSGKTPSGNALATADFTPSVTPDTDTNLGFHIAIGQTAVPVGSTLVFTLSTKHPDASPVTLSYSVPSTK
jgi:hypothetical protein